MKPYLYTTSYILRSIKIYRKVLFLFFLLCVTIIAVGQSGSGGGSNSGSNSGSGSSNSGPGNNDNNKQLQFNNARLETGSEGTNGAVYRFPLVGNGIDALVKITGRSDNKVKLVSIDLTNTGWQKAFQPQIAYASNSGNKDWWMEFEISFVAKDGVSPATVSGFDVTALDIDGDGNKIREYVTFYKQKNYRLEDNSLLGVLNILESLLGLLTPGKKFTGPTTNYMNVDTSATRVMVTNHYDEASSFRFRLGGTGSGNINVERMYSMYFKSFAYTAPREFTLPLVLNDFNATLNTTNQKVMLNWQTGMEKELSHFVVERSVDGTNFTDAGMVFAGGSSGVKLNYSYTEQVVSAPKGIIYYRLRMVDMDKKYQHSGIRVIRTSEAAAVVKMTAYPNPAVNEVHVTVPNSWQNKAVNYQVFNNSGQLVKQINKSAASQTQTIDVKELGAGLYVVKASTATETATQRIVKK
jgi:hypothetical protein